MLGYFLLISSIFLLAFQTKKSVFQYEGTNLIVSAPYNSEICIKYNLSSLEASSGTLWVTQKPLNLKLAELVKEDDFKIYHDGRNSVINVTSDEICLTSFIVEYNNSQIFWSFKTGIFNLRTDQSPIATLILEESDKSKTAKLQDDLNQVGDSKRNQYLIILVGCLVGSIVLFCASLVTYKFLRSNDKEIETVEFSKNIRLKQESFYP